MIERLIFRISVALSLLAAAPSAVSAHPGDGLIIDRHGDVYIADWGRRRVLHVTKSGKVSTLLRPESPWSPEGVAYSDGVLYVLEVTTPPSRELKPRVRALKPGGELTTIYEHGK